MSDKAPEVIFVVGPTATGKTRLSIELAQRLNGEIVNADSRQVYLHMEIGTAKPSPHERSLVPHHLFDLLPPSDNFSLGSFLNLAKSTIQQVNSRGSPAIVCGGTGQYIWALYEGWDVPEVPPDEEFRRKLEAEAAELGGEALYERLNSIDPERANTLDARNVRRVIRALEIHHATGLQPSAFQGDAGEGKKGPVIGLTMDRDRLYERIDARVDQMMADGFLEEASNLQSMGYALGEGPLACPGYRELGQYLKGEISLQEARQRTKFQTHRLARRQYTWFKPSDPRINWLSAEDPDLAEAAFNLSSGTA
ncbi:MAG: tRNA (adenosine(37)-N6)-dimethylallyltransferase MiaA [Chloroflexi bacterium]|nr:tRNA (adenosine(37)-N6)-dimethylallyltransferase MiaA [Chloroflexota bacterium]